MQTKLSVTVVRNVDLCSPLQAVLFFVLCFLFSDFSQVDHYLGHDAVDRSSCFLCLSLLRVRCTFLFQGVYFLHSVSCRARLQGKIAAHNNSVVSYSDVSTRAVRPGIRGCVCVEPKLERDRGAT